MIFRSVYPAGNVKKGRNRTDSPTVSAALPPQENNIPPEPPATTVARLDRRAKQLGTSLEWFSPWDLARTGMASTGIATRKTSNTVVRTRATLCLLSETGKATKRSEERRVGKECRYEGRIGRCERT